MKKTAVEWLVEQMIERKFFVKNTPLSYTTLEHLTNQAKAMEKQQIIEAWDNGFANGYDLGKYDDEPNPDDAEQYYNENFKAEE